jgi:hypothetical protein
MQTLLETEGSGDLDPGSADDGLTIPDNPPVLSDLETNEEATERPANNTLSFTPK